MGRKSREKKERWQGQRPIPRMPDLSKLDIEETAAIVERTKASSLSADDHAKLVAVVDNLRATKTTLDVLKAEFDANTASLERLRHQLFGSKSEKTSRFFGESADSRKAKDDPEGKKKKPGHGRNAASAFTGAEKVKVPHPSLNRGDHCPGCADGHVYPLPEPAVLVRITGMAPLGATIYERDRLRCNLCGEVFTALSPEGVGESKYDESATAMVGVLKYGTGMPFNRIEKLQQGMGIPMPAATQWELVQKGAKLLESVHEELIREAAQGEVVHNDDTTMKVLELSKEQRAAAAADEQTD